MLRSVRAIVAGYLVFGISAGLLFGVSGQDPHVLPSRGFLAFAVGYAIVFSSLAGWTAAALAPKRPALHAAAVAIIITVIALVSLVLHMPTASAWSEIVVIVTAWNAAVSGYRRSLRAVAVLLLVVASMRPAGAWTDCVSGRPPPRRAALPAFTKATARPPELQRRRKGCITEITLPTPVAQRFLLRRGFGGLALASAETVSPATQRRADAAA